MAENNYQLYINKANESWIADDLELSGMNKIQIQLTLLEKQILFG